MNNKNNPPYTPAELQRYFNDPDARHGGEQPHWTNLPPEREPFTSDRAKHMAKRIVLLGLSGVGVIVLGLAIYMWILSGDLPSLEELENPQMDLASIVYTADGEELGRFRIDNRVAITLDQISPDVLQALIDTEDRRFYTHWGVDMYRMASLPYYALQGKIQGASTITQQLARNLYPAVGGFAKNANRKLREIMTAVQIERNYSKPEILQMYLNTVDFANHSYGIEAASNTYFNKSAADLTLLESATLVGMLKNAYLYNPRRFPERARQRRNVVLAMMMSQGHLEQSTFDSLKTQPVELDFRPATQNAHFAPHFAEFLRQDLNAWSRLNNVDLYRGGLRIFTTIDSRMQAMAEEALLQQSETFQRVNDIEWSQRRRPSSVDLNYYTDYSRPYEPFAYFWETNPTLLRTFITESKRYRNLTGAGATALEALTQLQGDTTFVDSLKSAKTRLEAGLVSIEPGTGAVRAWVGGRDFLQDQYDKVALAKRQPGSTFKAFAYAAAIDNNYSPYYTLMDSSITIEIPGSDDWTPRGGEQTGLMITLKDGLAKSNNYLTARLVHEIGAKRVKDYAHRMGIASPLDEVPALALGVSSVTLLELAGAYGTFANQGMHQKPVFITRIEDKEGNELAAFFSEAQEALSPQASYTMVDMLRGVVDEGTATRIRSVFGLTEYDLAGKTGTTQNRADGWFMMIHPELVTGAWMGFSDQRIAFRQDYWGQGGHNALYIVGDFFRAITRRNLVNKDAYFEEPIGYEVPMPFYRFAQDSLSERDTRRRRRIGY